MTPQDERTYLNLQKRIDESLTRIAIALELMIPPQAAPSYQFALDKFATMDWESIGAVVVRDSDGASAILWRKNIYVRRSPSNKFEEAIWFSRCTGRDEKGANIYERLITFKAMSDATPLPQQVADRFG